MWRAHAAALTHSKHTKQYAPNASNTPAPALLFIKRMLGVHLSCWDVLARMHRGPSTGGLHAGRNLRLLLPQVPSAGGKGLSWQLIHAFPHLCMKV
eukprot:1159491-Pelagomonas_calceolata.AAC.28